MVQLPQAVFNHILDKQMSKHVRPPTKKHLGTQMRKVKPFITTDETWHQLVSGKDLALEMDGTGRVKPTVKTASREVYKVKLQELKHLRELYHLEDRNPTRGMGASKLIVKRAMGPTGKMVAMVGPPWIGNCRIPLGQSSLISLPSISFKHNVVMMDENTDVTFGVKDYPAWMKKQLRAEIYSSYLKMGQAHLPVDPALYDLVRLKLADTALCGKHCQPLSANVPSSALSPLPKKIRSSITREEEIDSILAEEKPTATTWRRFRVRWAGYEASWEMWRTLGEGLPGSPVETWEPLKVVAGSAALKRWREQQPLA